MRVALTIATRNRLPELIRTHAALARLDPPPDELWICADGCEDDTVAWVRAHWPQAQLIVHAISQHSIRSRDEMIRRTTCDIVVGLDDDSYPLDADFVRRVRQRFEAWPRCAVLSFPQRTDEFPATLSTMDFGPRQRVGNYVNAASALRRRTYLELGGCMLFFEHAADEPEYSLRCIAAGWDVIYDTSCVFRHHWSALMRNEIRIHHRHARNEFWTVLLRCPSPWWPWVAVRRAGGQFIYACRRGPGWVLREPQWWFRAVRQLTRVWRARAPVAWTSYQRAIRLTRRPEAIESN
jgi:GT2 family glycosyltransferase